ncbi:hypothetical protein Trydic_g16642 [Trypoxylus dichotomus]
MALSQKHSGKILVPWFNSYEWRYVYSLIYSQNSTKSDKEKAVEILQIWKVRMPILFAGLEGTLIILNAMLYDDSKFTRAELSSFYALAIMRFLNLCAASSDQQGTLFRVAKKRKLPDWLVSIRHDLAHSQKEVLEKLLQGNKLAIRKAIDIIVENDYLLVGIGDDIQKIPHFHIEEWESLIQYVDNHDMLMELIKKINYVCTNNEDLSAQKGYSYWLKEILIGLNTKTDEYMFELSDCEIYTLKLQPPNENFMTQLKEFVNEALETPHPYLKNYFTCLTALCSYNQSFAEDLQNLLEEYFNAHTTLTSTYVPITLEDVKQVLGTNTFEEINPILEHPLPTRRKRWSKIEDINNYEGCPLGVLHCQNRDRNPAIKF